MGGIHPARRWRRGVAAVILSTVAVFSGCTASGGVPASDVTPEGLVGAWHVPSHEGVALVIHDDQTFEMRDWPSNLGCDSPAAEYVEDVAWADGRDFTGTWQLGPEGYEYSLSLFSDGGRMPRSAPVRDLAGRGGADDPEMARDRSRGRFRQSPLGAFA